LAVNIKFTDLGLLVVDEEQRFGVGHKEKLKALRADVNVLTLTATPIPRTLQMALSGIRDLSLIATPPVDRLAVRTYVAPFDQISIRKAILRERYRGGQTFFVAPRIKDLTRLEEFMEKHVPEVKYVVAHGQMAGGALEDIMTAFYDGQYDVLLSTSIIESGIDIPRANTMIIYRADRFGLAQLYQMRGRVGRSRVRAYAYMTIPEGFVATDGAIQRLKVLQSLDTLGAGFTLASHDLDMRGGGNPLGEEQSGYVKDVGVELYQHMLEEAVAELRDDDLFVDQSWSPNVNVGVAILIPEAYIEDLNLRLATYRRISDVVDDAESDALAAAKSLLVSPSFNSDAEISNSTVNGPASFTFVEKAAQSTIADIRSITGAIEASVSLGKATRYVSLSTRPVMSCIRTRFLIMFPTCAQAVSNSSGATG